MTRPTCATCARWTKRLVHRPDAWDVAARPPFGLCDERHEFTSAYDTCAAYTPQPAPAGAGDDRE